MLTDGQEIKDSDATIPSGIKEIIYEWFFLACSQVMANSTNSLD